MSEYSFLANAMIAWSTSSPPTRMDLQVYDAAERDHRDLGDPPADVDDHVPGGPRTGSPAPIAAAIGSSMM